MILLQVKKDVRVIELSDFEKMVYNSREVKEESSCHNGVNFLPFRFTLENFSNSFLFCKQSGGQITIPGVRQQNYDVLSLIFRSLCQIGCCF